MPSHKFVVLSATIEIVERVPVDWDADEIEFYKNESSSCANNTAETIASVFERAEPLDAPCLCNRIHVKYLRDATAEDVVRDGLDPSLASSIAE